MTNTQYPVAPTVPAKPCAECGLRQRHHSWCSKKATASEGPPPSVQPARKGYRLIACTGEAHSNPHVDNCGACAPRWGWLEVKETVVLEMTFEEAKMLDEALIVAARGLAPRVLDGLIEKAYAAIQSAYPDKPAKRRKR